MNFTPWPPEESARREEALREQGATPDEIAVWSPVVARLVDDWPDRAITLLDTQRLLSALAPLASQPSATRQAACARYARHRDRLLWLWDTALTQVSILRPSFWVASALVALLCVYLELASWDSESTFVVGAFAPLLAFIGVNSVFRGISLRTVEYEIACPPSPMQLALARVVVMLGYDIALGTLLSLAGWIHAQSGGSGALEITLRWLTPLLLVAGLALALSLRLPVSLAAGVAYSCWLAALGVYYLIYENAPHASAGVIVTIPIAAEIVIGLAGLALLIVAIARFSTSVSRLMAPVSRA